MTAYFALYTRNYGEIMCNLPFSEYDEIMRSKTPRSFLPSNLRDAIETVLNSLGKERDKERGDVYMEIITHSECLALKNKCEMSVTVSSIGCVKVELLGEHIETHFCPEAIAGISLLSDGITLEPTDNGKIRMSWQLSCVEEEGFDDETIEDYERLLKINHRTALTEVGYLDDDGELNNAGKDLLNEIWTTTQGTRNPLMPILILGEVLGYITPDGELTEKGEQHPNWVGEIFEDDNLFE